MMGGRDGPPKPPALAHAPGDPGRGSVLRCLSEGATGPPSPPRSHTPRGTRGAARYGAQARAGSATDERRTRQSGIVTSTTRETVSSVAGTPTASPRSP